MNRFTATLFLLLLIAIIYPAVTATIRSPYVSLERRDLSLIVTAVKNYKAEYGYYPLAEGRSNRDLIFSANNRELFDILRNIPPPAESTNAANNIHNKRGIVFMEVPESRTTPPKSGLGPDGTFYDRWGMPYFVRIDANEEGIVKNPIAGAGNSLLLQKGVIAWTYGENRAPGPGGDAGAGGVFSWR